MTSETPKLRTDRVRMLGFITKNPSISQEEFDRHWLEKHSKLILSLDIVQKNLLKYEQVRVSCQVFHTKANDYMH